MFGCQRKTEFFDERNLMLTGNRATISIDDISIITFFPLLGESVSADHQGSNEIGDFTLTGGRTSVSTHSIAVVALFARRPGAVSAGRWDTAAVGADESGICTGNHRLALFVEFDGTVAAGRHRGGQALAIATEVFGTGTRDREFALFIPFKESIAALLLQRRPLPATERITTVSILRIAVITILANIEDTIPAGSGLTTLLANAGNCAETVIGTANTRFALFSAIKNTISTDRGDRRAGRGTGAGSRTQPEIRDAQSGGRRTIIVGSLGTGRSRLVTATDKWKAA